MCSPCLDSSRSPGGHAQDLLSQLQQWPCALLLPFLLLLHGAGKSKILTLGFAYLRPQLCTRLGACHTFPLNAYGSSHFMHGEGDLGTELEAPAEAQRPHSSVGAAAGPPGGTSRGGKQQRPGGRGPWCVPRAGAALGEASTNPAPARRCLRNFAEVGSPSDSLANLIKEQTRNGPPGGGAAGQTVAPSRALPWAGPAAEAGLGRSRDHPTPTPDLRAVSQSECWRAPWPLIRAGRPRLWP